MFPSFGRKKEQTTNEECNWEERELLTFCCWNIWSWLPQHLSLSHLGSTCFAQLKLVVHIVCRPKGAAASGLVAGRRYESV